MSITRLTRGDRLKMHTPRPYCQYWIQAVWGTWESATKVLPSALAGVAQWTECQHVNQKVADSVPSQGASLDCRPGPQLGACERQLIYVSLPFFLPPLPSF